MYFQPGEPPGSVEDDHIPFLRRGTGCREAWGEGVRGGHRWDLALTPSQGGGLLASCLTYLCLDFLIFKMGIIAPISVPLLLRGLNVLIQNVKAFLGQVSGT